MPTVTGDGGCVVSAIANYVSLLSEGTIIAFPLSLITCILQTSRANDGRYSDEHRKEALEFLIHFIGDVTQPLHDEAEALGGNEIDVTWDGHSTNLHACWDTKMVERAAGGENTTSVLESFASKLETRIDNGTYSSDKDSWVDCVDKSTAVGFGVWLCCGLSHTDNM